jgi:hypothetical protein
MRCSCGWIDPKGHGAEHAAINAGNAHVRSVQRAGRSPADIRSERAKERLALAVVVIIVAIAVGVHVYDVATRSSYKDGANWARVIEQTGISGGEFPGCNRSYMMTSKQIEVGGFQTTFGAGEAHDNYSQWRAGCELTK